MSTTKDGQEKGEGQENEEDKGIIFPVPAR
jgi:hypothetical protein